MILYTKDIENLKIILESKPTYDETRRRANGLAHVTVIYPNPTILFTLQVDKEGVFWIATAWTDASLNSFAFELSYDPIQCHWELTQRCLTYFAQMGIDLIWRHATGNRQTGGSWI